MYGSGNSCVAGNCRTDSDCGTNGFCSPSSARSAVGYVCHTPQDTCINDDGCPTEDCRSTPAEPRCVYSGSAGHWQCQCVPIPMIAAGVCNAGRAGIAGKRREQVVGTTGARPAIC